MGLHTCPCLNKASSHDRGPAGRGGSIPQVPALAHTAVAERRSTAEVLYLSASTVLLWVSTTVQYSTVARPDQPLNPTPHQLDSWIQVLGFRPTAQRCPINSEPGHHTDSPTNGRNLADHAQQAPRPNPWPLLDPRPENLDGGAQPIFLDAAPRTPGHYQTLNSKP